MTADRKGLGTRVLLALVLAAVIAPITGPSRASASPALEPAALVRKYIADLGAHRYLAAYSLEATCGLTLDYSYPSAPGAHPTLGLPARPSSAREGARALNFVRSVRVTSIRTFTAPVLRRYRLVAARVAGEYRFAYPKVGPMNPGNNEVPSGWHRLTILVRRCGGPWEIDPNWRDTWGQGGPILGWR